MEEYHHHLYRRPQMTGQAREEEEVDLRFPLQMDSPYQSLLQPMT